MTDQKIVLYKLRDFSQKMNATIDYIRNNFAALIKAVLIVVIPLSLIFGFVFGNFFSSMKQFSANPNMSEAEAAGFMSGLMTSYSLMLISSVITYAFLISVIYTFMKERDQDRNPEPMEIIRMSAGKVPGLIGLSVLIIIVVGFGSLFFLIPGIYLAIALSMAAPVYLFEGASVTSAFSKSFDLIKGKWWSTFGLMMVSGLIALIISYIFSIPSYALMFGQMFTNMDELNEDPSGMFDMFSSWYSSLMWSLMMVGGFCTYLIPIIALGFQYFNLSERMERTGLKTEIKDFENLA